MIRAKQPILVVAVLLVGIVGSISMVRLRRAPQLVTPPVLAPAVVVMRASQQTVRARISSQGILRPLTESQLVAQVSGVVSQVSPAFAEGGAFERGDVLLEIDRRDHELVVVQAQAAVARAEAALEQERGEAESARLAWERLGKGQAAPLVLRAPQMAMARANLESARATLTLAELNLSRTRITAPYRGRLRKKVADLGQFVGPGTLLATIYSVDAVEVRLPITDEELGFMGPPGPERGPEVFLSADFSGVACTWNGRIVRRVGEVDLRSRMVHVIARVEVARDADIPVEAGIFVDAEILGLRLEDAVVLPRSALRPGDRVYLVDAENHLRVREVRVARREGDRVILESGLQGGDRVCLSPLENVVDGMSVRVAGDDEDRSVPSLEERT